jgi:hypothetical protein
VVAAVMSHKEPVTVIFVMTFHSSHCNLAFCTIQGLVMNYISPVTVNT